MANSYGYTNNIQPVAKKSPDMFKQLFEQAKLNNGGMIGYENKAPKVDGL